MKREQARFLSFISGNKGSLASVVLKGTLAKTFREQWILLMANNGEFEQFLRVKGNKYRSSVIQSRTVIGNSSLKRESNWPWEVCDPVYFAKVDYLQGSNLGLLRELLPEVPQEKLIFASLKEENNPFNDTQSEVGKFKRIIQSKVRNSPDKCRDKRTFRSFSQFPSLKQTTNLLLQS